MSAQHTDKNSEEMSEESEMCAITVGAFTAVLLFLGSMAYTVMGIIILIDSYDNWLECKDDSSLWPYALISLILFLNKTNIFDLGCLSSNSEDLAIGKICASYVTELCLFVWGSVELFKKAENCDNLINSDLWKFSLASFILQIIYALCVLVTFILICLVSKEPKEKSKETISEV